MKLDLEITQDNNGNKQAYCMPVEKKKVND